MSTDAEVPLLEVRAGSVGRSLLLMVLHGCALAAIMLGSWLGRFTALERIAAYLPPFVRSIFILDYWVWAAGVVVLLVGLVGLMCYYEPRMGRARFFADRLELEKYVMVLNPLGDRHTVRWETVVAFDDSFSSHVRLAMSPRRWFERYRFTIPTPSEG
ncbi:MAG: hypothetical protein ACAI25_20350, partial [Planctomycetota bacterium]